MRSALAFFLILTLTFALLVNASVTVYYPKNQQPFATPTGSAAPNYTLPAAFDPTVLVPPPIPNPAIPTTFAIQLQNGGVTGLSIPLSGAFMGFSIEFSVVNQLLGKNSSILQVPFLNLMSNLQARGGRINIRVGGNTQETAVLVPSLPDGKILEKNLSGVTNPTDTPPLVFTPDVLYMMANISSLVNVRWYLGIPFNDTTNFRLEIAELGQSILGDHLIGLQAGNEPDLYVRHNHRPATYGPYDYFGEFGLLVQAMGNDTQIHTPNMLIGPNIATGDWIPEMVWDTGFITTYAPNLAALAVEHYPTDNCFAQFGVGVPRNPQDVFPTYLNHTSGISIVAPYLNSSNLAQGAGKPFIMFETNTASCGGFGGISDSFGAALWALDFGLQMAYSNFSGALMHVGGQNVYYNPFTAPPTNQSTYHQWTIGPLYYSALVTAETLGTSNISQVLDLNANGGNIFTPAYAIFENGNPVRLALFNYVTDPSGASDYTVSISIGGGQTGQPNATPAQVNVKYLLASSVSQKGNFTWAGQTFGGVFESDGILQGQQNISTIQCDPNANTCQVRVPAPGFALVFLSNTAFSESSPSTTKTFPTTVVTHKGAIVDPSVLATSNGNRGMNDQLGSTTKGKKVSGMSRMTLNLPGIMLLVAMVSGACLLCGLS